MSITKSHSTADHGDSPFAINIKIDVEHIPINKNGDIPTNEVLKRLTD